MLRMMIAMTIARILFAAPRHDIGMRGSVVFLPSRTAFAASAAAGCKLEGRARIVALSVAAPSCLTGWAVFLRSGTR